MSKPETTEMSTYFENVYGTVNIGTVTVKDEIVYRYPSSKQNGFRNSLFFDEWCKCLAIMAIITYDVIITGDLNFNVDNKSDVESRRFCNIFDFHGLTQHVNSTTHK